jgi:hypothetical protein
VQKNVPQTSPSLRQLCQGLAAASAFLIMFTTACSPSPSVQSPEGTYSAKIKQAPAAIDTHYKVSVAKPGRWPWPRQTWDIGCFSDDDPDNALPVGLAWTDDSHLVINLDMEGATVEVSMTEDGPAAVTHHGDSEFNCYGY